MLNAQWMLDSGGERHWKTTTWTSRGKQFRAGHGCETHWKAKVSWMFFLDSCMKWSESSAKKMVGRKALNPQTSVPSELWKCSSPLADCTHQGRRLHQGRRKQFYIPPGCWPHRWGWHGAGLSARSQPECMSCRLVLMSFSAPILWGCPCSPRSHSGLLWPQRLCTPGWRCTSLVWWMLIPPESGERARALG